MEPEKKSLEKVIPFGNHHFQVPCLNFEGVLEEGYFRKIPVFSLIFSWGLAADVSWLRESCDEVPTVELQNRPAKYDKIVTKYDEFQFCIIFCGLPNFEAIAAIAM